MPTERFIAMPRPAFLWICLFVLRGLHCPAASSDPLPSPPTGVFRVLSWNVSQENLFRFADRYRAMFRLANPDLLLLDEIQGSRTQADVAAVLAGLRGTTDTHWNILVGAAGGYQRPGIMSRHPLEPVPELDGLRYPDADIAALKSAVPESKWTTRVQRSLDAGIPAVGGVVRLGDRTLLAVAIDLQCCNDSNDWPELRRQIEAREIRRAIQRVLEKRRVDAVLVAGDLNLVGGNQPLETLTQSYPEPHRSLVAAPAVHLDGQETWTWDGRGSAFPSGRLDYSFFSPGSLHAVRSIVLSTEDLAADVLSAHGLQPGTSRELSDHLPVIVDYQWRARLVVDSPQVHQVFQRDRQDRGEMVFRGEVPAGCDRLDFTIQPSRSGASPIHRRLRVPTKSGPRTFEYRITVPAGGGYRCQVHGFRAGESLPEFESVVPHVGVGDVFVIAGQSNAANHGSDRQQPESGLVTAFDGIQWKPANDPQPGASGNGGSFIPAFGDAVAARTGLPVGVICLGAGGTSVREWLPQGDRMSQQPTTGAHVRSVGPGTWEATGELFDRLAGQLQHLGPHGCRAVLWHQGESDAGQARAGYPADRQITGDQYVAFMRRLIAASRDRAGWRVPWFTAQATYHSETDPADDEFRAAQAKLWNHGWARPGPDTDALRAEYRDGVHFNARGLRRHGQLWAESVLTPSRSR